MSDDLQRLIVELIGGRPDDLEPVVAEHSILPPVADEVAVDQAMHPEPVNFEHDAGLRPEEVGAEAVQRVLGLRSGEAGGADQRQGALLRR